MSAKKFILTFLLIALIPLILIELHIRISINNIPKIQNIIELQNSKANCIIMGDSHTGSGFPARINGCFNISQGGSSIPMIADAVKSSISKNDINKIILALDPHNFAPYRLSNYNPIFKNIAKRKFILFKDSLIRSYYFNWLRSKFFSNKMKKDWVKYSKQEQDEKIIQRLSQHYPVENFYNTQYARKIFNLVEDLINKNIDVCIVRVPVTKEYEKRLMTYTQSQKWDEFTKTFINLGATYIDYKSIPYDFHSNENLFSNQDHLNAKGAEIYAPFALKYCFGKTSSD